MSTTTQHLLTAEDALPLPSGADYLSGIANGEKFVHLIPARLTPTPNRKR